MNDSELRDAIFHKFYELRHRGILQLPNIVSICPVEPLRVVHICEQLAKTGLIEWKTSKSLSAVGGIGKITAGGVDVIEGTRDAPEPPALHDHGKRPTVPASGAAAQNIRQDADRVLAAIERSGAPKEEKTAAKSLAKQLSANPLAWSALRLVLGRHP